MKMRQWYRASEAAKKEAVLADRFSPNFRPAFSSSAIISERSSPSRVRFAAPNNGAPLTAPGRSEQHRPDKRERLPPKSSVAGDHFAAKMAAFFTAINTYRGEYRPS
jgi:hypothetical protein